MTSCCRSRSRPASGPRSTGTVRGCTATPSKPAARTASCEQLGRHVGESRGLGVCPEGVRENPRTKCGVVDLDAQRMRRCWICMSSGIQCVIDELSYIDLVLWTTMTVGVPTEREPS